MRVAIGADHAGYETKSLLVERLRAEGYEFLDLGTDSAAAADYPDYARAVAEAVIRGEAERGILVCGSGAGAALAADKLPGIRAVLCHDTYTARQCVEHDDANVLALGARAIGPELAVEIARTWLASRFVGLERHVRRLAQVATFERRFPIVEAQRCGQSLWVHGVRRGILDSGELRELIRAGVGGAAPDLALAERAIAGSTDYAEAIRTLAGQGLDDRALALALLSEDARAAAVQLRPVYELTDGADGYAIVALAPDLAHDASGTVAAAKSLWQAIACPNVMVAVPATAEGVRAMESLLAEGINASVTGIVSPAVYEEVGLAYLRALERRCAAGEAVDCIASVAGFSVGRVDVAVDALLRARLRAARGEQARAEVEALLGRAAIANARLAYLCLTSVFSGPRWEGLSARGARVQRLLWTGTGPPDPRYRDVRYVEELIGPYTVAAAPSATLRAFLDHGYVRPSLADRPDEAEGTAAALARLGIDLADVTAAQQRQTIRDALDSFERLLAAVAARRLEVGRPAARSPWNRAGTFESRIAVALDQVRRHDVARRLWAGDPDLWKPEHPAEALVIRHRLGWLSIAAKMRGCVDELVDFAAQVRQDGFRQAVLLGMGGSSLAPEVLRRTFGTAPGYLDLLVLDTTDPATILRHERALDLPHTLFLVASKSGTTVETLSHLRYFYDRVRALRGAAAGEQFVAITDAGTPLQRLARERHFREVFVNPPDIGGRYSALSFFGLVPAALLGLDLAMFLERAERVIQACVPGVPVGDNPGLRLGAALGALAGAGRNKVTLVLPPALASFGAWIEQLVAESTGKEGRGLVPVDGEPLGDAGLYGADRVFVALRVAGAADAALEGRLDALAAAGHPVLDHELSHLLDLGGEFFSWELATAVASALLKVNPFDEPNVQESKDNTKRVLATFCAEGRLPEPEPALRDGDLTLYGDAAADSPAAALAAHFAAARPGDYLALQAYLPYDSQIEAGLAALRLVLRDSLHLATTVGFGPRFLHSTGQLHKGGPNNGIFLQLTADDAEDVAIPGELFSFGALKRAQALGDFAALRARGRRVLRAHLGHDPLAGLRRLTEAVCRALS